MQSMELPSMRRSSQTRDQRYSYPISYLFALFILVFGMFGGSIEN
jgi:hypothetical protein